jgi:hypothetical protein
MFDLLLFNFFLNIFQENVLLATFANVPRHGSFRIYAGSSCEHRKFVKILKFEPYQI